ncbi:T-cell surface glycoprotein CD3 delta chain-like isoform X2 [Amblyraja radiata]|uniref:T-cell surface glycoprotein CD3 delta chain-like isoform X2 n=1 Tax=Amblyraja radiata TaxID=386614 RepID=UPI0014031AAB|nr:T-cell surface glycoprotein CD3 delta chain-like isoform X2 [Amblyraja radiata]
MQFYRNLVFAIGATILLFGFSQEMIVIKEESGGITMKCPIVGEWEKDGVNYAGKTHDGNMKLTKLSDTDTGEYTCTVGQKRSTAFVFVKLCKNCVQLDANTISGIVIGDLIATVFIALAIYCVASSKGGKASDEQHLVPHNNDLYQDLRNRRGSSEYSQLAPRLKI